MDQREYVYIDTSPLPAVKDLSVGVELVCQALSETGYEDGRRLLDSYRDVLGKDDLGAPVVYWLKHHGKWGVYFSGWRTCEWMSQEIRRLKRSCLP